MPDSEPVFGVYLDRFGGAIMHAEVLDRPGAVRPASSDQQATLKAIDCIPASWPDQREEAVLSGIRDLATVANTVSGDGLIKLAISSPGPFVSLNHQERTGNYGTVHPTVGNAPMRGFNLPATFRKAFQQVGGNPQRLRIEVHTDAQACAMGETVSRGLGPDATLAFILVTEGIGLGLVRGRAPIGSALHSEFGMMPVRWRGDDHLKPDSDQEKRRYSQSLSQLAENRSLWKRVEFSRSIDEPGAKKLIAEDLEALDQRAYYLAQGCLACAVMMAPHQIVLGADLDYEERISAMTTIHFRKFLAAREIDREPVFDYPEMNEPGFISNSQKISNRRNVPYLHVTGALGLCHAAATMPFGANFNYV